MKLDTRGFMDGALRGFEVVSNYQAKQDAVAEDKRRYETEQTRLRDLDKKEDERYKQSFDFERDKFEHKKNVDNENYKISKAQIDGQNAERAWRIKKHKQEIERQQKHDFLTENNLLIQRSWDDYLKTGRIDKILDNNFIKGGVYDPRRYNEQLITSFGNLEANIPKVLNGEVPVNSLIPDLAQVYKPNVELLIGHQDETGKTIKTTELSNLTLAEDIDPKQKGNQPGFVLGVVHTYEDGSKSSVKPITEGRDFYPGAPVKVIPLVDAMKDVQGQMILARTVGTSPYYKQMFIRPEESNKEAAKFEAEYRGAVNTAYESFEKTKQEIAKNSFDPQTTQSQIAAAEESLQNRLRQIESLYGKGTSTQSGVADNVNAWATDRDKKGFIAQLVSSGVSIKALNAMHPEQLDLEYQRAVKARAEAKRQKRDAAIADMLRGGNVPTDH